MRRRAWFRWIFLPVLFSAMTLGAVVLWWVTTHIDGNGHLRQPAIVLHVPGGFLQATAMRNGLHCIAMRSSFHWRFSIQFERATYLGNAGGEYHGGHPKSFGGFTVALLTKTLHDYDSIQSPYAAIVFPYWFLASASGGLLLYSTGLIPWILLALIRRSRRDPLRTDTGIES